MRDRSFARPIAVVAQFTLLLCLYLVPCYADENLEYQIKAAYLYNFTKFINWPETNTTSFNICIVGDDPFENLLNSLENKTAFGKPIRVHRYHSSDQAKDCHILYFDKIAPLAMQQLPSLGSLSVSSQPDFAESGGMIGFVLEDEKVKLHINLATLKQSGLSVSAKLIEVSTLIEGKGHE